LYLHAVGHLLRLDHGPVVHLIGEVDDHAFSAERGQRDRGHVLAARDDVHLAIEMRPGVKRRLQILRDDAVGGVALEVAELRRRVADPPGCVDREDVRQIDQLHPLPPPSEWLMLSHRVRVPWGPGLRKRWGWLVAGWMASPVRAT